MKYDIFISYSRKDFKVVSKIAQKVSDAGYSVWMDVDGIESGDEFKEKIVAAIEDSEIFLFFSSSDSNVSPWTVKEVNVAVALKKNIIPIKLDESAYNKSIMFDLAGLDFIQCNDKKGLDVAIKKLMRSLEKRIGLKDSDNGEFVNELVEKRGWSSISLNNKIMFVICLFMFMLAASACSIFSGLERFFFSYLVVFLYYVIFFSWIISSRKRKLLVLNNLLSVWLGVRCYMVYDDVDVFYRLSPMILAFINILTTIYEWKRRIVK